MKHDATIRIPGIIIASSDENKNSRFESIKAAIKTETADQPTIIIV